MSKDIRRRKKHTNIRCPKCKYNMVLRKKVNFPFGKNSNKKVYYYYYCQRCKLKLKLEKKNE